VAVSHASSKNAAKNIASAGVGGENTVGDESDGGARMVCNYLLGVGLVVVMRTWWWRGW
jgi:hypothetical protein